MAHFWGTEIGAPAHGVDGPGSFTLMAGTGLAHAQSPVPTVHAHFPQRQASGSELGSGKQVKSDNSIELLCPASIAIAPIKSCPQLLGRSECNPWEYLSVTTTTTQPLPHLHRLPPSSS